MDKKITIDGRLWEQKNYNGSTEWRTEGCAHAVVTLPEGYKVWGSTCTNCWPRDLSGLMGAARYAIRWHNAELRRATKLLAKYKHLDEGRAITSAEYPHIFDAMTVIAMDSNSGTFQWTVPERWVGELADIETALASIPPKEFEIVTIGDVESEVRQAWAERFPRADKFMEEFFEGWNI